MDHSSHIKGVGLGLRREFLDDLSKLDPKPVDFLEIAPENWMYVGGRRGKKFEAYAELYPIVCHGLSLSVGGPAPLDFQFLDALKTFFNKFNIAIYSEHLSYCSDKQGQLYDLLPIPFTEEAVHYVAERIRMVQAHLERALAIENVSYYCAPGQQLKEIDFLNAVLDEADCELLLDVNNVYVNSVNHGYDPHAFLKALPTDKIRYIHIAGHLQLEDDLIVDTHGADVIDPVWDLLQLTYEQHGIIPTLLERDNDVPSLEHLLNETKHIQTIQAAVEEPAHA